MLVFPLSSWFSGVWDIFLVEENLAKTKNAKTQQVVIINFPDTGHINPTLPLVAELANHVQVPCWGSSGGKMVRYQVLLVGKLYVI